MAYYLDDEKVSLDDLRLRLEGTDLVPSRVSLLDGITIKFKALEHQGITTLACLRKELKSEKRLKTLSETTSIDPGYLVLLRREIECYFPKPSAIREFDWLPEENVNKLVSKGISSTIALYEAVNKDNGKSELVKSTGIDAAILEELIRLANLTRVQWVGPTVARMLVAAGYDTNVKLADADAEELCSGLVRVNEGNLFYKGKIGLRDVKRLILAASYIPD